jgi:hypothetical protein
MIGTAELKLPTHDGRLEAYAPGLASALPQRAAPPRTRIAYAAAHVVADPLAANDPWLDAALDWDATLAYRRYLWGLGLSVAEGMDTAQRGMGLDWTASQELIRRTLAVARAAGVLERVACGAGTDQLAPGHHSLDRVIGAYEEQCAFVEAHGGRIILMASRALAAASTRADDYLRVYERVLVQVRQPVIIHWLGDMFDPQLAGYWGSNTLDTAAETCIALLGAHADKIDGIKVSLLDKQREIALRRRLPRGMRMYSGDDFDYPELMAGDDVGFSDALLGIFDAIAPAAVSAMASLDAGDPDGFHRTLAPTVPLARHIFRAPTRFYKTGIVFLAYLNGHQSHFTMVGGQQSARSLVHLADVFRLADRAGLLLEPDRAVARMRAVLAVAGVE